jgi:hypothetical protein
MPRPEQPRATPLRTRSRVALLVLCGCAGVLAAIAGRAFTGSDLWYLAIPITIGAGWLLVADPTSCEPRAAEPAHPARRATRHGAVSRVEIARRFAKRPTRSRRSRRQCRSASRGRR